MQRKTFKKIIISIFILFSISVICYLALSSSTHKTISNRDNQENNISNNIQNTNSTITNIIPTNTPKVNTGDSQDYNTYSNWNDSIFNIPEESKTNDSVINSSYILLPSSIAGKYISSINSPGKVFFGDNN